MRALAATSQLAESVLATLSRQPAYVVLQDFEAPDGLQRALVAIRANDQQYQSLLADCQQLAHQRKAVAKKAQQLAHDLLQRLPSRASLGFGSKQAGDYLDLLKAFKHTKRQGLASCPADPLAPALRLRQKQFTQSYAVIRQRCLQLSQRLHAYRLSGCRPAAVRYDQLGAILDTLTAELTGRYEQLYLLYQQQAQLHQEVKHRVAAIRGRMGRI